MGRKMTKVAQKNKLCCSSGRRTLRDTAGLRNWQMNWYKLKRKLGYSEFQRIGNAQEFPAVWLRCALAITIPWWAIEAAAFLRCRSIRIWALCICSVGMWAPLQMRLCTRHLKPHLSCFRFKVAWPSHHMRAMSRSLSPSWVWTGLLGGQQGHVLPISVSTPHPGKQQEIPRFARVRSPDVMVWAVFGCFPSKSSDPRQQNCKTSIRSQPTTWPLCLLHLPIPPRNKPLSEHLSKFMLGGFVPLYTTLGLQVYNMYIYIYIHTYACLYISTYIHVWCLLWDLKHVNRTYLGLFGGSGTGSEDRPLDLGGGVVEPLLLLPGHLPPGTGRIQKVKPQILGVDYRTLKRIYFWNPSVGASECRWTWSRAFSEAESGDPCRADVQSIIISSSLRIPYAPYPLTVHSYQELCPWIIWGPVSVSSIAVLPWA